MAMASFILNLMRLKHIGHKQLAAKAHLTERQLHNFLSGDSTSFNRFCDLCWALNVRPVLTAITLPHYRRSMKIS